MKLRKASLASLGAACWLLARLVTPAEAEEAQEFEWLAGDHHVHSHYSAEWDKQFEPPKPILGGDADYSISKNAELAQRFGLRWMVSTDHGGPNHSQLQLSQAYPELLEARATHPGLIQFYGLELYTPGGDHSSLILAQGNNEAQQLHDIQSRFDVRNGWPRDEARDNEARMLQALAIMNQYADKPLVMANHPSKSAPAKGEFGKFTPDELRAWNDTAPEVAIGMAGAPGHQAKTLNPDGSLNNMRHRGDYDGFPTLGGFDQMTAVVGGVWDAMLSEGRRWWITANSDSHVHYTEGGMDFWPGEYSKTYVYAQRTPQSIIDGMRNGRMFVVTGDLITSLNFELRQAGHSASIGETLPVKRQAVELLIQFTDPETENHGRSNPRVRRVDLIVGEPGETARVLVRFSEDNWERDGEVVSIRMNLYGLPEVGYLRLRGTNTDEMEPLPDPPGENPWQDLWFYSNPIFFKPPPQ